ncbi:MAG: DUF4129 domain-containing protein [Magnetococcus sp. DMHC-1]
MRCPPPPLLTGKWSIPWVNRSPRLRQIGILLLQAFPLATVLFLLLPRPQGDRELSHSLRQIIYGTDGPQFGGDAPGSLSQAGGMPFLGDKPVSGMLQDLASWVKTLWNAFIDYGALEQQEMWLALGLPHKMPWWWVVGVVKLLLALLLALLTGWISYRYWRREDPAVRLYRRFCQRMARHGTPRMACEGPVAFSQRAAKHHPLLAPKIEQIGQLYAALRYGRDAPPEAMHQLRYLINNI